MNVRFFGGTKEQYLSLATPRNPLGLYFCADTRELFWGDRLLSDGTRIVATEADLPNLAQAADGITYFVEATRNGYVISPDRSKWVQVIYAPQGGTSEGGNADGDAVKAISFAGTKMEEVDGVFTIDRRCAREALGFIVPEGLENDDIEIVTKEYVDSQIAKIPGADIDLSEYAKQEDLDDYAKKADIPSTEGLATEQYVIDAIAAQVPVEDLAKKEEVVEVKAKLEEEVLPTIKETILPTVQELAEKAATQEWVKEQGYLTEHQSLEGLATEEFVIKKIAEAALAGQDVDLSAYYTKSEVDALIPEVPTKVSELENDAGYITAADVPATDLSNYYNKTETENLIAEAVEAIEHPTIDLEGYATEEWVNEQGFLKEHQDLSEYAKKSDIPDSELFVVDFNAPDFAAAVEAYNNGKLLLLVNAAPDANGYAVMNYVRDDMITFTKFLTSRSEAYGSFNTYYLHSDNTWEISKEVRLNKVEANIADEPTADLTSLRVGKEVYKLPDLANYVTNETLEQNYITREEIANTYVTEEHISNTYVTVQQAEDTYVTNEQVTEVVTNEINTVVTERIEDKVTEVIENKIEAGEILVNADAINYDTWDEEW